MVVPRAQAAARLLGSPRAGGSSLFSPGSASALAGTPPAAAHSLYGDEQGNLLAIAEGTFRIRSDSEKPEGVPI